MLSSGTTYVRILGMLMMETSESPGFIATGSFWISPGSNQFRMPLS
jgi:hypothetical protein